MAQPPPMQMVSKGLEHYFNSPEFSDVRILITPRGAYRAWDWGTSSKKELLRKIEMPAHKIILAAGSSAFRHYFETHDEESSATGFEVRLDDIYSTKDAVATSVLRHLYGLDIFHEDSDDLSNQDHDWKNLCDAADGFGITGLKEKTMDRLEAYLQGLLEKGLSEDAEDGFSINQFVKEVHTIHSSPDGGTTAAFQVAAKLCCKHFTALRKHDIFNELSSDCPDFFRTVLDYVVSEGLLAPR